MGFKTRFVAVSLCLGIFIAVLAAGGATAGISSVVTVTAQSDTDSSSKKKVEASCPQGENLFASGGGAKIAPGKVKKVALTTSEPTGTDGLTGPTGWKAKAVEVGDQSKDWTLKATVVCIDF